RRAAAVQTEGVGVERIRRPGEQCLAALAEQVVLGAAEQLGGDALTPVRRKDAQLTDDAAAVIESALRLIGSEAGPCETDKPLLVKGDKETIRIEIGLGEEKIFQPSGVLQMHGPTAGERFVPDFDQSGWIAVAKGSIVNHTLGLSAFRLRSAGQHCE